MTRIFIVILALIACSLQAAEWYVSTTGTNSNNGSITNPFSADIIANQAGVSNVKGDGSHPIQPGDTVWIRGGTYVGNYTNQVNARGSFYMTALAGTSNQPVLFRNYNNERVIFDGRLDLFSVSYCQFWGVEVTLSDPPKPLNLTQAQQTTALGVGTYRQSGIWVLSSGCKLINCIINDNYNSSGFFFNSSNTPAYGALLYGCIFINNGGHSLDNSYGHGVYSQNYAGTLSIVDCVFAHNFLNGLNMYSGTSAPINDYLVQGNISYENGFGFPGAIQMDVGGSDTIMTNQWFYSNVFYNIAGTENMEIGYGGTTNANSGLVGNTFLNGGFGSGKMVNLTFVSNTVYSAHNSTCLWVAYPVSSTNFDYNNYWVSYLLDNATGTNFSTLSAWQAATSLDQHSVQLTNCASCVPTLVQTFVRPNQYEAGRANIAIINWASNNTVSVDVSGIGLQMNQTFVLHSVQDYFGDVATYTYTGQPIVIGMTNRTVSQPRSHTLALADTNWMAIHTNQPTSELPLPSTFPKFGAFVLIGSAMPSSAANIPILNAVNFKVGPQ